MCSMTHSIPMKIYLLSYEYSRLIHQYSLTLFPIPCYNEDKKTKSNRRLKGASMSEIDLLKLGNFLKTRRVEQNLSIRELATLSNIASSTISQIETGKTSPNLMSINALCESLHFPIAALFVEEQKEQIKLTRKNEQQTFVRNVSNGTPLIQSLLTRGDDEIHASSILIPPNTDSGNYVYHSGEEFALILKGSLIYDLENTSKYRLQTGDTLYYPNHIGHRWYNETSEECELLLVSTDSFRL